VVYDIRNGRTSSLVDPSNLCSFFRFLWLNAFSFLAIIVHLSGLFAGCRRYLEHAIFSIFTVLDVASWYADPLSSVDFLLTLFFVLISIGPLA